MARQSARQFEPRYLLFMRLKGCLKEADGRSERLWLRQAACVPAKVARLSGGRNRRRAVERLELVVEMISHKVQCFSLNILNLHMSLKFLKAVFLVVIHCQKCKRTSQRSAPQSMSVC